MYGIETPAVYKQAVRRQFKPDDRATIRQCRYEELQMNFHDMIDTARIDAAKKDHAALTAAVAEAEKNIATAKAAVSTAEAAAQNAADRGDATALAKCEEGVDGATRNARAAERLLVSARKRLENGERKLAVEIRLAHGAAMNAAMQAFMDIRKEALAVFARLEELKSAHVAVRADIMRMANAANVGVPNVVDIDRTLLREHDGRMMDQSEFDGRTQQPGWAEWDASAGKLRWTE